MAPSLLTLTVPSLLIQPFIENALWHGILPYRGKKECRINLTIFLEKKDVLTIRIEDNGIGRAAASANKPVSTHVSKGIELIRERLKAYQLMNNNCLAELNIIDLEENGKPTGTLVEIKITVSDE
jgi:sensor histidine kinase YesM